jgi:hypothetical protein
MEINPTHQLKLLWKENGDGANLHLSKTNYKSKRRDRPAAPFRVHDHLAKARLCSIKIQQLSPPLACLASHTLPLEPAKRSMRSMSARDNVSWRWYTPGRINEHF